MPLTRPPSLSDSFAYHSFNIERAEDFSIQYVEKKPKEITPNETKTKYYEHTCVRYLTRFLFHILLIGLFETIFFFYYISEKENKGLSTDVNIFLNQVTSQCGNLTTDQKELINDVINLFINITEINANASRDSSHRDYYNHTLFIQAWMYEVGIFVVFLGMILYSRFRKIPIPWKRIIIENMGLISLLASYEYAFFSTIVYRYIPISTYELEAIALKKIEDAC